MTKLQWALLHAERGIWVFRLHVNGKKPMRTGWQREATRDAATIAKLFSMTPDANIGGYMEHYFADRACVAVDEDNKGDKKGADTICSLEFDGKDFPPTYTQTTPTGGKHHVYHARRPVNQGNAGVVGPGVDLRSRGGYIVMSGSTIDGVPYTDNGAGIVECPEWLFNSRDIPEAKKIDTTATAGKVNAEAATARAMRYLEEYAPGADDGERNSATYKLAARLKDFGIQETECLSLVAEWNGALENPLEDEELETTVRSAYKTSANVVGAVAAEVVFDKIEVEAEPEKALPVSTQEIIPPTSGPVDSLNKNYAIVSAGGGHHILYETVDMHGRFKLEHLQEYSFHRVNAHRLFRIGNGDEPITNIWMKDTNARRYEGLVFAPNQKINPKFYNLWRGFTCQPVLEAQATPEAKEALRMFLEHAFENVCGGDEKQFKRLISFFAHLIQRPEEKPLFALVFKGEKGVGKNALVAIISVLLGTHAMLSSKKRFLTSNFNGHMENLLMLVLDEAFWSGDKEAEAALKDLITGLDHNIERKGQESYIVANLLRLIILGNDKWLVPASHDERRFEVYAVNKNRQFQAAFFIKMKKLMEQGGYQLLLSFLQDYDISDYDISKAMVTPALIEQKIKTLELPGQWWYDCMRFGELPLMSMTDVNFIRMEEPVVRQVFGQYCRNRNARTRLPDNVAFYEDLKQIAPSLIREERRGASAVYKCQGGLAQLRKDFETYIGGKIQWQDLLSSQEPEDDVMS